MSGFGVKEIETHVKGHLEAPWLDEQLHTNAPPRSCADLACVKHRVAQDVSLLDFVNHLIRIHGLNIKPLPNDILSGSRRTEGWTEPALHVFSDQADLSRYFETRMIKDRRGEMQASASLAPVREEAGPKSEATRTTTKAEMMRSRRTRELSRRQAQKSSREPTAGAMSGMTARLDARTKRI